VKKLVDDLLAWVQSLNRPRLRRAPLASFVGGADKPAPPWGRHIALGAGELLARDLHAYLSSCRSWSQKLPLAGPLIDAALKAAPAEPRLRFRDEKDQIINPQVPVTPGQIIKVQIEPRPEDANIEYVWQIEGVEEYWGTDPWERWLRVPDREPGEPPSLIMVIVKHPDGDPLDSWMLPVEDGERK